MRYLVVTSRAPVSHEIVSGRENLKKNVGGVVTALRRLMMQEGGTWVSWGDGNADNRYLEEDYEGYHISRIILEQREKKGFYDDYSNGTLWPLFHYFRDQMRLSPNGYKKYEDVNRKFAEKIIEHLTRDTIIWVHDYQLMLVPGMLREKGVRNLIIFTWHIPWVASEFYSILPEAKILLSSVSKADMITFHTHLYERNFHESVKMLFGTDEALKDRTFVFSLGIDVKYYSSNNFAGLPSKALKGKKLIFSVDRLDYTKGLISRVMAIETLIKKFPKSREKFIYVMVVTPSRTSVSQYEELKRELEMTIGRVNGLYSDLSWQPIVYIYRKVSDTLLMSYYRKADIALITPLIDGLNLVSKEFVAASQNGILILSEFAGAAFNLKDAILVNPNDPDEVAQKIHEAMFMEPHEITRRLWSLKRTIQKYDLEWWLNSIKNEAIRIHEHGDRDIRNRESIHNSPE